MAQIVDLREGKLAVCSDIHGNWDFYESIRYDQFSDLKRKGVADLLLINGDSVHGYGGYEDNSKKVLDDLIDKQDPSIIFNMGNHELMHIYHMSIPRGSGTYSGPLEEEIKENRQKYIDFFIKMPYATRTKGGVVINHTGTNDVMTRGDRLQQFDFVNEFDHEKNLDLLRRNSGLRTAEDFNDKIFDEFAQSDHYLYLWNMYFNKDDDEFPKGQYEKNLTQFLDVMSSRGPTQNLLVSGHTNTAKGYKILGEKQLRTCYRHGVLGGNKYLTIVDANKEYKEITELVDTLQEIKY